MEAEGLASPDIALNSAANFTDVIVRYLAEKWLPFIEAVTSAFPAAEGAETDLAHSRGVVSTTADFLDGAVLDKGFPRRTVELEAKVHPAIVPVEKIAREIQRALGERGRTLNTAGVTGTRAQRRKVKWVFMDSEPGDSMACDRDCA